MSDHPLPMTTWGSADAPLPDWKSIPDDPDPDDEELAETPADVIEMLGFDPLHPEIDEAEADAAATTVPATPKQNLKGLVAMLHDTYSTPAELKFIGSPSAGEIEGYASIFGNTDSHGDVIAPGAFERTLAEHKASGRKLLMYGEHSPYKVGGDPYPIGYWTSVETDEKGLRVKGQFVGRDHPDVNRAESLARDGLLCGLSVAYSVFPGGAVIGRKAGEPKRLLKSIDLASIDLVANPSNPGALIDGIKAILQQVDAQTAKQALLEAIDLHKTTTSGGNSPTSEQRQMMAMKLQMAYCALTGEDMPSTDDMDGMKSIGETIRDFEAWLREKHGFSNSKAREIGELVFKSKPRDEVLLVQKDRIDAVASFKSALAGFSLTST